MSSRDCRWCFKKKFPPCGIDKETCPRFLLMGNPNVGKSVFFSNLTGLHSLSSNYSGTTVGFTEGVMQYKDELAHIIDVPGAYTLEPTNEAEEIALRILNEGADKIILVVDATALERNLVIALQVLEHGLPTVVALNMVDEARHSGVNIDISLLEKELGVPVIPTVAVTGQGMSNLVKSLDNARVSNFKQMDKETRWQVIGKIIEKVQTVTHRHYTFMDIIENLSSQKFTGAIIGLLVLAFSFILVRVIGEGIINYVTDPIFDSLYRPLLVKIGDFLGEGTLSNILIGKLFDGSIDFEQSLGVLSTGIYVEFGMVLPYIISFYGVLSFLEDFGYLPRLAVVFDALLHSFGIHGYAIIPTLLGLGCNVPGILGTRVLASERERFIAITLISVAVPCVSIQAMLASTLGRFGMGYVAAVYIILLFVWMILGRIMNMTVSGFSPELIVEIPPYRIPSFKALGKKLWFRVKDFLYEATPLVLLGILLVNLLETSGALAVIAEKLSPIFKGFLGLPPAAAIPIIMGVFRKDIAMGLLIPLGLTAHQSLVAVVVLAMTFPCIATFIVMWKELGWKKLLISTFIMITATMLVGGLLNFIFKVMA